MWTNRSAVNCCSGSYVSDRTRLFRLGPGRVGVAGHGHLQRVLDHLKNAARRLRRVGKWAAERRGGDPRRQVFARANLAPNHHVLDRQRARLKRSELRPGHPGDDGSLGGIDDRLGNDRLASRTVSHHDATGLPLTVAQHVGRIATVEKRHAGRQQRLVERFLHMDRTWRLLAARTRPVLPRRTSRLGLVIVEDLLGQFRVKLVVRLSPKPQRGRHVVPEIRPFRGQEHLRPRPGRFDRRGHSPRAAPDHDHVDLIRHGKQPRRLVDGIVPTRHGRTEQGCCEE